MGEEANSAASALLSHREGKKVILTSAWIRGKGAVFPLLSHRKPAEDRGVMARTWLLSALLENSTTAAERLQRGLSGPVADQSV